MKDSSDGRKDGFALLEDYCKVAWYGRGPHECYPDRKQSAYITTHTAEIADLKHGYVRPQENGTRCDVRWVSLESNKLKIMFKDLSGNGVLFSAYHTTQENIQNSSHDYKLQNMPLLTFNIDGAMCGVGGNVPGIAALYKKYRLPKDEEYCILFEMKPFSLPESQI